MVYIEDGVCLPAMDEFLFRHVGTWCPTFVCVCVCVCVCLVVCLVFVFGWRVCVWWFGGGKRT